MGLLETYQDPGLDIDLSQTADDITIVEVTRLQAAVAVVTVTGSIPRRLSDATREELALDKRRARRALHAERQCLGAWEGKERLEPTAEERVTGAQLDWESWLEDANVVLSARLRYVATWAKKTDNLRFGKTAVVRLAQELEWLRYALRD